MGNIANCFATTEIPRFQELWRDFNSVFPSTNFLGEGFVAHSRKAHSPSSSFIGCPNEHRALKGYFDSLKLHLNHSTFALL